MTENEIMPWLEYEKYDYESVKYLPESDMAYLSL
jgi:hypothetical protein